MATTAEIRLKSSGFKEAAKDVDLINKSVERVRKEVLNFKNQGGLAAAAVGADRIQQAEAQIEVLNLELQNTVVRLKELQAQPFTPDLALEIASTEAQAASLRIELGRLPVELREQVSQSVSYLGDLDTGFSTVASTLASVGSTLQTVTDNLGLERSIGPLSAFAQAFDTLGIAFGAAEAMPRGLAAFGTFSTNINRAKDSALTYLKTIGQETAARAGLVGETVAAVSATNQTAGGIVALTASMAPAVLAIGSLIVVLGLFAKMVSDSDDSIRKAAKEGREALEDQKATREDAKSLTSQDLQDRLDELRKEHDDTVALRDSLAAQFASSLSDIEGFGDSAATAFSGFAQALGINVGNVGAAVDELERYNKTIREQEKELRRLEEDVQASVRSRETVEQLAAVISETGTQILDQERARLEIQTRLAEDLKTLDEAGAKDRIDDLRTELSTTTALRDTAARGLEGMSQRYALAQKVFKGEELTIILRGLDAQTKTYQDTLKTLSPEVEQLTASLQTYETEVLTAARSHDALTQTINANKTALETAESEFQSLTDSIEGVSKAQKDLQAQLVNLQSERDQIDALKTRREEEDKLLEAQYQAAKAAEELGQSQQRLIQAEDERVEQITEVETEFVKTSLERLKSFQLESKKLQDEFSKSQLRKTEDLYASLIDAAANRDIVSFIQLQTAGTRDLQRAAEDFSDESQQRAEEFAQEETEARTQRQQALSEIQTNYQERIVAEQEGQKKILTVDEMFAQARAKLQERRAEEDLIRQRQAEDRQLQEQLRALQQEEQTLQAQLIIVQQRGVAAAYALGGQMTTALLQGVGNIAGTGLQALFAQVATQTQVLSPPVTASSTFAFAGPQIPTANAMGGFYPGGTPRLLMAGESSGTDDYVVPVQRGQNFWQALNQQAGAKNEISISFPNMQVGEILTPNDLQSFFFQLKSTFASVVNEIGP